MRWTEYVSITEAAEDIPDGQKQNIVDAIPDVYGKALQLYFALRGAIEKQVYNTDEVLMWRGLLTLLALQEHLNLPLSWEKVIIPESSTNQFNSALRRPPSNPQHMLFQEEDQQWNGTDFYVLKWKKENGAEVDLLLYSPITLVYPVADWRKVFASLCGVKWYDTTKACFLPAQEVLNEHEREIVYFWMEAAKKYFNFHKQNEAQKKMATHLDRYMEDLGVVLTAQDRELFSFTEIDNDAANPVNIFNNLKQTVQAILPLKMSVNTRPILTNQIFADQICYFQATTNPFNNCLHSESYQIANCKNRYAFLPVHPILRAFCGESKLITKVNMRWFEKNGNQLIHTTLVVKNKKYERDYRVVKEAVAGAGLAAPYKDGDTDEKSLPLISVWPNNINDTWQKYYIMLDGSKCKSGKLKIAGISDQNKVHTGDNQYAIQTDYPPYAIPIVRRIYDNSGEVSVGIVIPKLGEPAGSIPLTATVAVDFGTTSTMVFARIGEEVIDLKIGTDFPLLVTNCDTFRERMMRDYFIPPKEFYRGTDVLFSIYRRSGVPKSNVEPILDGVIYQTGVSVDLVEDGRANGKEYLMTNLKWQIRSQEAYYVAFMKQLVHHITSLLYQKGVNSIIWKYALPESLPEGDQKDVKKIWEEKLIPYLKQTAGNIEHTVCPHLTESEAASRYFLSQPLGPVQSRIGYLVVDIGGGSTDIALWQGVPKNAQMKWHASINVAGRKMFTRWIIEALPDLCAGVSNERLEGQMALINQTRSEGTVDTDTVDTLVEILLNANYDDLLKNYHQNCRESVDGWGKHLYLKISKAVSILVFALGYQIGVLLSHRLLEIPDELGAFVIAFAGRGARMLDWMESVDPNDKGTRDGRLKNIFSEGVKAAGGTMTSHLQIIFDEKPKREVAKGLLVDWQPESHDFQGPANVAIDTLAYIDGAEKFIDVFGMYFGGVPQTFNPDTIAAQLVQHTEMADQIVNVFMQIIYGDMTK